MKKFALALTAFALALALPTMLLAAEAKPAVIETYQKNAANHVFTIHGKEYSVPISFDFATAQSAARHVAANPDSTISVTIPPALYFPQSPCSNGQCPIPPKRR